MGEYFAVKGWFILWFVSSNAVIMAFAYFFYDGSRTLALDARMAMLNAGSGTTLVTVRSMYPSSLPRNGKSKRLDSMLRDAAENLGDGLEFLILTRKKDKCVALNQTKSYAVNAKKGEFTCTPGMLTAFGSGKSQGNYQASYREGVTVHFVARDFFVGSKQGGPPKKHVIWLEKNNDAFEATLINFRIVLDIAVVVTFVAILVVCVGVYLYVVKSKRLQNESKARIEKKNESLKMLGSISRHDCLNNLSVVQTALQFIDEAGWDKETFDMAKDETDAAIDLLQSISTWSKIIENDVDGMEKKPVCIASMIETVMPEGINAEIGELGEMLCDRGLMQAVFRNCLENSSKYSMKDPVIKIWRDGDVININDNAGGFGCVKGAYSEEYARRLMRPSQRGEHGIPGSGLGLANCQAILDAHNYQFAHTTECGKGTTWHIKIDDKR